MWGPWGTPLFAPKKPGQGCARPRPKTVQKLANPIEKCLQFPVGNGPNNNIPPLPPRRILTEISQSAWPLAVASAGKVWLWPRGPRALQREYYYIPISYISGAKVKFMPTKWESATVAPTFLCFPASMCSKESFSGVYFPNFFQRGFPTGNSNHFRQFSHLENFRLHSPGELNSRGNAIYLQ